MTTTHSIPFARPIITDEERKAVLEVLENHILTHGPQNKAFAAEFAQFIAPQNSDHVYCTPVSSCMAALHLSYWQLGIGPGDEVIVTALSHVATAHAVEIVGAKPIFVDCEGRTGNIDVQAIEQKITPKTKAIGLVHFLGIPCEMDKIMNIAQKHNLKIIEDCALAVGTSYNGTHAGLIGDTGCFSFYPVKHLTTGEGGMFVTRHQELAEKVSKAMAFGVDRNFTQRTVPGNYDAPTLGINYRMSDINAAIGRKQLAKINQFLELRANHFTQLKEGLKQFDHISILDTDNPSSINSHYCLSLVLEGPLANERINIIEKLKQTGIGTSIYYPQPIPRMSYYKMKYGYDENNYSQAKRISDQSIALPVGPHLKSDDISYILENLKRILKELT